MLEGTDSPEQRRASRRARRWRRRAGIAAPFLAVPVILGLLVLSVDLIEYHPTARPDRTDAGARLAAAPARTAQEDSLELAPESVLAVSVVDPTPPEAGRGAESTAP